jgi:hypothetical protein
MSKLIFHGGVNEVGGNRVFLEDQGTHLYLDMGKSYSKRNRFFNQAGLFSTGLGPVSISCPKHLPEFLGGSFLLPSSSAEAASTTERPASSKDRVTQQPAAASLDKVFHFPLLSRR